MGDSFAAGTTDGPGAFNFKQGSNSLLHFTQIILSFACYVGDNGTGYAFWNLVRDLLATPSDAQIKCQHPKPILLDTANMTYPYEWVPSIVPLQILRVGRLFILAVPGEFTTMSGRRLRDSVKKVKCCTEYFECSRELAVLVYWH